MDTSAWGGLSPNVSRSPGGSVASTGADFLLQLLQREQLVGPGGVPAPGPLPRGGVDWMPLPRDTGTATPQGYDVNPFVRSISAMLQNPMPEAGVLLPHAYGASANPFLYAAFGGQTLPTPSAGATPQRRHLSRFPGDPGPGRGETPWDLDTALGGSITPGR